MLKYLKNSEISFRIGLNPVNWKWMPAVAYDGPTPFYPKRRTYALAFLFLQAFLDLDNGEHDLTALQNLFGQTMNDGLDEVHDVDEVGQKISALGKGSLELE